MRTKIYIPLSIISKELGLPTTYLKELAEQHKIRALKVYGRLRFNPEAVKQALDELAAKGGENER
jgi:excisionase family DNA binding protein